MSSCATADGRTGKEKRIGRAPRRPSRKYACCDRAVGARQVEITRHLAVTSADARTRAELDATALASRISELAPWYQNVRLPGGISTKSLGPERSIFPGEDIPAPLWSTIAEHLDSLAGKRVLDIGCNAGYMSFECKRRGASYVLGVDDDSGATTSFIRQAEFCRDVLGLDVEFRRLSFFDLSGHDPFDVVLFCGVLYHLENWADGLDKVAALVAPEDGVVVLETAVEAVTHTTYRGKGFRGDPTTYFVPSKAVLLALLAERGFVARDLVDVGERVLAFLRIGTGDRDAALARAGA